MRMKDWGEHKTRMSPEEKSWERSDISACQGERGGVGSKKVEWKATIYLGDEGGWFVGRAWHRGKGKKKKSGTKKPTQAADRASGNAQH